MASTIHCDLCQQEPAQTMQTNVENGDVLAVGANCLLVFYLSVAQTMLDNMPAENIAAYGEALEDVITRLGGHVERGDQAAEAVAQAMATPYNNDQTEAEAAAADA